MKARRVGLWAAGIFVAGHVSGCAFAWMAAARADDVATVVCSAASFTAEYDIGTADPAEMARVSAIVVFGAPRGAPPRDAVSANVYFKGSKAIASCNPGDSVAFVVR